MKILDRLASLVPLSLFKHPVAFAIYAVVVGIVSKYLSRNLLEVKDQNSYIIGLIGGILSYQITNMVKYQEISENSRKITEEFTNINEKIENILELQENLTFLKNNYNDNKRFVDFLRESSGIQQSICLLKRDFIGCDFLFEWKEDRIYGKVRNELRVISEKKIIIDDENKEIATNSEFLDRLAKQNVYAVSFQDLSFWRSPAGKNFLKTHDLKLKSGVSIHRIFIVSSQEVEDLKNIILQQKKIGVEISIVEFDNTKANTRQDFVIYDETYVRFARPITTEDDSVKKHATLSFDPLEVRKYKGLFDALKQQSSSFEEFYSER